MLRHSSISVSFKFQNGATALVVAGTTGEAANLSRQEHCKLIRIATGVSRGRVPIIAGAGSNSTQHAIELTKRAGLHGMIGKHHARQPKESCSSRYCTKIMRIAHAIEDQ
jgi:Dihydrodipicolinate synthetase family